jgi:multidrug efflux pump subunit AcrB
MLSNGTGSDLRKSIGHAMPDGTVVSPVVTLFTTPMVNIYME